jgi:carbon-monoxide dehydrogenase small subunit
VSDPRGSDVTLYSIQRREPVDRVVMSVTVNGTRHRMAARPYDVLLDLLRERIGLTGTKRGCDMGTCGCCTVILEGRPVLSCLTLALQADGARVTTIEGIAQAQTGGQLHPVQQAFADTGASQCGFCTPGFVMTAVSLIEQNPDPTEAQIREAISGNMCRCTGYLSIIEAITRAARVLRERGARSPEPAPTSGGAS